MTQMPNSGRRFKPVHTSTRTMRGWCYYALSVATLATSLLIGLKLYPGDFDWQYTVVSALASTKHNPDGGQWFAGGLGLAMIWLWPFTLHFWSRDSVRRRLEIVSLFALRCGILFGALMAIESILSPDLPDSLEKTHEVLALFSFLMFFVGILGTAIDKARQNRKYLWPTVVIIAPLVAIGISQFTLYIDQRDLGWVDQSWREIGVPVWQSFAFWQWLALAALWLGIGLTARLRQVERPVS